MPMIANKNDQKKLNVYLTKECLQKLLLFIIMNEYGSLRKIFLPIYPCKIHYGVQYREQLQSGFKWLDSSIVDNGTFLCPGCFLILG